MHVERPDDTLNVLEAAVQLNLHPETVRRRIREGSIPGFKSGNMLFVEAAAVEELKRRNLADG